MRRISVLVSIVATSLLGSVIFAAPGVATAVQDATPNPDL